MHDLLITNCKLVNVAKITECSFFISDQRIVKDVADLQVSHVRRVPEIDSNNIIPGLIGSDMIDDQVRYRESGLSQGGLI